jgi:hypothetical protein
MLFNIGRAPKNFRSQGSEPRNFPYRVQHKTELFFGWMYRQRKVKNIARQALKFEKITNKVSAVRPRG